MSAHLCLSCRHAKWTRGESGRFSGGGFCDAQDPELPPLPATKWWSRPSGMLTQVRGGYLSRRPRAPVENCHYYDKATP